jgi:hypothetical protein
LLLAAAAVRFLKAVRITEVLGVVADSERLLVLQ